MIEKSASDACVPCVLLGLPERVLLATPKSHTTTVSILGATNMLTYRCTHCTMFPPLVHKLFDRAFGPKEPRLWKKSRSSPVFCPLGILFRPVGVPHPFTLSRNIRSGIQADHSGCTLGSHPIVPFCPWLMRRLAPTKAQISSL